ncbi:MAG TPA: acyl-CoA desaturase [Pseudonocardia sp.]|jgi:stearoyl-CoA desaturase (delta-9 desaturase)|nr:acyl-CoA desaturase [Pseudonocardia sp.]
MSTVASDPPTTAPLVEGRKSVLEQSLVIAFMIIPVVALVAAVMLTWGWGITLLDVVIATIAYFGTGLGVTVGFHRHFTHKSFKATRPMKVALAITGSLAFQGSIVSWVADHRRHHAFSDKEGDPHSPWLFGTGPLALVRGFWHAHMGWLFDRDKTNARRFAPDLLADRDVAAVDRQFVLLTAVSLGVPALLGGLLSWSWWGALTAFLWGGLVRVGLLHHVTWSINSICHMAGRRPFGTRDRSANVWWLAVLSFGESWHNLHHADPTCARHGVKRGQIDMSARLIWLFEKFGWVHSVRWPTPQRLERLARRSAA